MSHLTLAGLGVGEGSGSMGQTSVHKDFCPLPFPLMPWTKLLPVLGICGVAVVVAQSGVAWPWDGFLAGSHDILSQRPVGDWAREGAAGVIPFTGMNAEKAALTHALPCKWTSASGTEAETYGRTNANRHARYDFLCKGGDWAAVTLMLDEAPGFSDGIGRVRLLWRETMNGEVSTGNDAGVARQFMRVLADRMVPADLSGVVQKAFMETHSHTWWAGKVLRISYSLDDGAQTRVHRLEITGLAAQRTDVNALLPQVAQAAAKASAVPPEGVATGLVKASEAPVSAPAMVMPQPKFTPLQDNSGLVKLPTPQPVPVITPQPLVEKTLTIPKEVSPALVAASPADLAGPPEPASLLAPAPLPGISATLVPDAVTLVNGRAPAPSNFAAYNKAEALTKTEEAKAMGTPNDNAKVKAAVQGSSGLVKPLAAPSVAPSLEAIGTPKTDTSPVGGVSATVVVSGSAPVDSGSGNAAASASGLVKESGATSATDPRFDTSNRPLPQLQYVPKAKPLAHPDAALKFEDEGGAL